MGYEIENLTIAANTCPRQARVAAITWILSLLEAKDQSSLTQDKFDGFKSAAVEFKILLATSTDNNKILPSQLCYIIPYLSFPKAQGLLQKITREDIEKLESWYEDYPHTFGDFNKLVENLLDAYDNGLTKPKFDRIKT